MISIRVVLVTTALAVAACNRGGEAVAQCEDEVVAAIATAALIGAAPTHANRATGYVEATEVRVAAEVGGRLVDVTVAEGDHVSTGDVIARIDTADTELALRRAAAEREQAQAQFALVAGEAHPVA